MVDLSKEFKDIQSIVKDGTSQNKIKQAVAKHEAQDKFNQYRDEASEVAQQAKEQASQWFETGRSHAQDWVETGRDYAYDFQDTASEVGHNVQNYWNRHSSHLYAIAIALLGLKLVRNLRKLTK
ncbi:hypothetical protein CYJ57_07205 [Falseniella ignava]|uniref:Uncharacterized protein n=1 Tax=Falseniella ignava TaxID=137730 RepID=A0A2I1JVW8_9LACT|nr:hypothetical protein [Falseniella ignava]PKY87544.1 hypothetical protein CYJ57_07205 [Falseniella ignava]